MSQPSAPDPSLSTTVPDLLIDGDALDLDLSLDMEPATAAPAPAPFFAPAHVLSPLPAHLPARGFSVDTGQTLAGTSGFPWQDRRVLVVSADVDERLYLRARLALAKLVWVDEAATTIQAQGALDTHRYLMAIFNLDVPVVDGLALAKRFRRTHPEAACVVTGVASPLAGPLGVWGRWHQWRREQALQGAGVAWLAKPLMPREVAQLFTRVHSQRAAKYK